MLVLPGLVGGGQKKWGCLGLLCYLGEMLCVLLCGWTIFVGEIPCTAGSFYRKGAAVKSEAEKEKFSGGSRELTRHGDLPGGELAGQGARGIHQERVRGKMVDCACFPCPAEPYWEWRGTEIAWQGARGIYRERVSGRLREDGSIASSPSAPQSSILSELRKVPCSQCPQHVQQPQTGLL